MTSPYRPEFDAAIQILASVSQAMEDAGLPAPVLVGGAAVELYTGGAFATGDLDVVTSRQTAFEQILQRQGFHRPRGAGASLRGWVHQDIPLGVEIVSSTLLEGLADRERVRCFRVDAKRRFHVISVEDMIADRMGQHSSGAAADMLSQAQELFRLYDDSDMAYLELRTRQETNDQYGIEDLKIGD